MINRMGFNNAGAAALADRLAAAGVARGNRRGRASRSGISIGKTKITPLAEAAEDYLPRCGCSPRTPTTSRSTCPVPTPPDCARCRTRTRSRELVSALVAEAGRLAARHHAVPILVKLAPDLTEEALEQALEVCEAAGAAGLIATNTTLARDGSPSRRPAPSRRGGRPLRGAADRTGQRAVVTFLATRTELPIIAVGGIMSRDDGQAMLDAGARLLQVYTGFIYAGPAWSADLNRLAPPPTPGAGPMTAPYGRTAGRGDRPARPALRRRSTPPRVLRSLGSAGERQRAGALRPRAWSRPSARPIAVFKPQSAFFEAYGSAGIAVLERTLADITRGRRAVPARRQARRHRLHDGRVRRRLPDRRLAAGRRRHHAQPVPRLRLAGRRDRAWPRRQGRGVYVLALTSNPEGPQLQQAVTAAGRSVGQVIVDEAAERQRRRRARDTSGWWSGRPIGRTGVDFSAAQRLDPGTGPRGPGRRRAEDLAEVFGAAAATGAADAQPRGAGSRDPIQPPAYKPRHGMLGRWKPPSAWGKFSSPLIRMRGRPAVTIPPLSDEQRQQARNAATEARRRRAEIKQALRSGERSLAEVLELAEHDDVVAHTKVIDVLQGAPARRCGASGQGDGAARHRRQPAAARAGKAPDRRPGRGVLEPDVRRQPPQS